jgi:SAM-dependent methyltransferase
MDKSEWNLYSQVYDIYYGDYKIDICYLDKCWQANWTSVLEIGCGSGSLLPFFEKKGLSCYFGFDTCPEMLSISLRRIKIENYFLCLGDYLHAGLQKKFDLIVYGFNTINY